MGLNDVTLTLEEAISKRVDVADIDDENKLTTVISIFRSWCLVYILKYFEVEETWSKFWDLCSYKNFWYDPKKGTLEKHSTLQFRFAFGHVFIFVPYKWSVPEVPFFNWNQFSTTTPAFESLRRVFSLVPWPKCILQSPEQSPEGQSLAPSEEQLAPQLTWHIMQYISYIWTMNCLNMI